MLSGQRSSAYYSSTYQPLWQDHIDCQPHCGLLEQQQSYSKILIVGFSAAITQQDVIMWKEILKWLLSKYDRKWVHMHNNHLPSPLALSFQRSYPMPFFPSLCRLLNVPVCPLSSSNSPPPLSVFCEGSWVVCSMASCLLSLWIRVTY